MLAFSTASACAMADAFLLSKSTAMAVVYAPGASAGPGSPSFLPQAKRKREKTMYAGCRFWS